MSGWKLIMFSVMSMIIYRTGIEFYWFTPALKPGQKWNIELSSAPQTEFPVITGWNVSLSLLFDWAKKNNLQQSDVLRGQQPCSVTISFLKLFFYCAQTDLLLPFTYTIINQPCKSSGPLCQGPLIDYSPLGKCSMMKKESNSIRLLCWTEIWNICWWTGWWWTAWC